MDGLDPCQRTLAKDATVEIDATAIDDGLAPTPGGQSPTEVTGCSLGVAGFESKKTSQRDGIRLPSKLNDELT